MKQLQVLPEEVALSMCSPSVSPSTTMMNLSDSAAALSVSSSKSSSRGNVTLCDESTGVSGLFRRAQSIGQGTKQVAEPRRNVIGGGGAPAPTPSAPAAVNNVVRTQQQQAHAGSEGLGGGSSGNMDGGSSLMAEVPDELLSEYNIRPSEDTPAPLPPSRNSPVPGTAAAAPARADPFSSRRLSPLKPSEKSQSLMADLMGSSPAASAGDASPTPAAKQASVWEDV